jgi:hypothetical protein
LSELDPANPVAQVTGSFKKADIPYLGSKQFEFGYLPNIKKIKPGDVLLTSSVEPNAAGGLVSYFQRKQTIHTAKWTHAAVYVGDWAVIEAVPLHGIRLGSILDYVPDHKMLFRRPQVMCGGDAHGSEIMGLKIALQAALRVPNSRYGWVKAYEISRNLARKARYVFDWRNEETSGNFVCSGLYSKCVSIATGQFLAPASFIEQDQPVTPAMLAGASTLQTLDVGWGKLED